jgi:hypothetical protein
VFIAPLPPAKKETLPHYYTKNTKYYQPPKKSADSPPPTAKINAFAANAYQKDPLPCLDQR